MAALLMAVAAQMDAQEKKEFTLEVYGGEIPDVKPAFEEEHFLGGEITRNKNIKKTQPIKEIGITPIVSSKPFAVCCFFVPLIGNHLKCLHFRIKVIKDIYSRFSSALPAPVPLYLLRVVLNL